MGRWRRSRRGVAISMRRAPGCIDACWTTRSSPRRSASGVRVRPPRRRSRRAGRRRGTLPLRRGAHDAACGSSAGTAWRRVPRPTSHAAPVATAAPRPGSPSCIAPMPDRRGPARCSACCAGARPRRLADSSLPRTGGLGIRRRHALLRRHALRGHVTTSAPSRRKSVRHFPTRLVVATDGTSPA